MNSVKDDLLNYGFSQEVPLYMAKQSPFQLSDAYRSFLSELKGQIRIAQLKASLAVNQELVMLYWQIGQSIIERQTTEG